MIEKKKCILNNALKCKNLKRLNKKTFLNAWKALAFLHPYLHPDEYENFDGGWPEQLKPLAREAFRMSEIGEFKDNQLYPASEALKGIKARLP
ncbi:MAG: hypothetical protein UT30_C0035G0004 [Candidatus Uhrbacteria bacterium GW2011_GWF2_39_13]|uniref:Uncharacterized protein n=1 Tax=Candidatus Uhrbacteria bacterium GW2011_GWF2_39_13 TaxID=1618995 RepID=A0A0G0MGQ3_9BACT|nr:MAG: hypothetical protein UT30_C0035G0004 [Candidatus Uhrbacteria bacterium GW2011_GWF2_39_13]